MNIITPCGNNPSSIQCTAIGQDPGYTPSAPQICPPVTYSNMINWIGNWTFLWSSVGDRWFHISNLIPGQDENHFFLCGCVDVVDPQTRIRATVPSFIHSTYIGCYWK